MIKRSFFIVTSGLKNSPLIFTQGPSMNDMNLCQNIQLLPSLIHYNNLAWKQELSISQFKTYQKKELILIFQEHENQRIDFTEQPQSKINRIVQGKKRGKLTDQQISISTSFSLGSLYFQIAKQASQIFVLRQSRILLRHENAPKYQQRVGQRGNAVKKDG